MSKFIFIDNIGRTIVSELISDSDANVVVKNPAMINVSQLQNGQLQVQLIPLFFSEFISDTQRTSGTKWVFNRSNISIPLDLDLDSKLIDQYNKIFTPQSLEQEKVSESVVKLFDDV